MTRKTIGVLGLGLFGLSVIDTLKDYDCDIVAVDNKEETINFLEPILTRGIVGDITDIDLLATAGIDTCDTVVVAVGENLEASVLAVMHAKTLGVPKVIAKIKNTITARVLEKIGADAVISPERETGISLAKQLLLSSSTALVDLDDNATLIEFYPPIAWHGKTLSQLQLRQNYQLNLIGYRKKDSTSLNIQTSPDYIFKAEELITAVAENHAIDSLQELLD